MGWFSVDPKSNNRKPKPKKYVSPTKQMRNDDKDRRSRNGSAEQSKWEKGKRW